MKMRENHCVIPVDPCRHDVRALFDMSNAYMSALYPAESNHFDSPEVLAGADVIMLGIIEEHSVIACGAIKILEDDGRYGEVKRVFVHPRCRGRGMALALMQALEQQAYEKNLRVLRLETGIHQPEALALYRSLKYIERAAYGAYAPDPLSVFMEKRM